MNNRHTSTDEHDPFDSLIDCALATYTPAAPRPGLEDRVLAGIASASTIRPAASSWRWAWLAGAAMAAAILLFVGLRLHPRPIPALPTAARTLPAPNVREQPHVPPQPGLAHTAKPHIGPHRSSPPNPEVIERGLSQQQIIADLMAHAPGAIALMAHAQNSTAEDPDKPIEIKPLADDPLVIDPIQIKPLDDSPAPTGGKF